MDRIEHLGSSISSSKGPGVAITVRHLDHPEWVVTFVFGNQGAGGIVIKPYDPPAATLDHLEAFEASVERWSRAAIDSVPEDGPLVTARLLRRLPIGEMEQWARGYLMASSGVLGDHLPQLRAWFGDDERAIGRRGRANTDRAYAELASAYLLALGDGLKVRDLARKVGWSPKTVGNRLTEARRRGLLTYPPPGRAGGELTEKARHLLAQEEVD